MVKSTAPNDPILTRCPLWLADYNSDPELPSGWGHYTLWQYTDGSDGPQPHTVNGIGACDRDQFNGSESDLEEFFHS